MSDTGHTDLTPEELACEDPEQITFSQAQKKLKSPCAFWLLTPRGDIIAANLVATWLWEERQLNSKTFFGVNVFELFSRHSKRIPKNKNDEFFRKKIPVLIRLVRGFGREHYKSFLEYLSTYPDLKQLFNEQKYIPDEVWNSKRIWKYSLTLVPPRETTGIDFLELQVTIYRLSPNNEFLGIYEPHPRSTITRDIFAQKFDEAIAIADAGLIEYVQYLDGIKQGGDLTITKEQAPKGNFSQQVFNALENPNYQWRTVEGVAKETGIPPKEVGEIIDHLGESGLVVEADRRRVDTREIVTIYTTRDHYEKTEPVFNRIISALAGKIK
jgi:hypothetical protein